MINLLITLILAAVNLVILIGVFTGRINYNTKTNMLDRFFVSTYVAFSIFVAVSSYTSQG